MIRSLPESASQSPSLRARLFRVRRFQSRSNAKGEAHRASPSHLPSSVRPRYIRFRELALFF